MRTNFILGTSLLMAGLIAGCSDDPAPAVDASTAVDTGTATDTGATTDRGTATDTGTATDAGTVTDTGTATDTGAATDAGTAIATIHGCTAAMYVDRSAGDRTITFDGSLTYSPKCLTITAGQTVTFSGSFAAHPLRAGVAPGETGTGATPTPIVDIASGSSMGFAFPTPGLYPYYCVAHAGAGMVGMIQVR